MEGHGLNLKQLQHPSLLDQGMRLGLSETLFPSLRLALTLNKIGGEHPDRIFAPPSSSEIPAITPSSDEIYQLLLSLFSNTYGGAPPLDAQGYNTRAYLASGWQPTTSYNPYLDVNERHDPSIFKEPSSPRAVLPAELVGRTGGFDTNTMKTSKYLLSPSDRYLSMDGGGNY